MNVGKKAALRLSLFYFTVVMVVVRTKGCSRTIQASKAPQNLAANDGKWMTVVGGSLYLLLGFSRMPRKASKPDEGKTTTIISAVLRSMDRPDVRGRQ